MPRGESSKVDLPTYIRIREQSPDIVKDPVCPECGGAVHTYDEKGALGFRLVNMEVGRRERGNRRSMPGFHHKDHQAQIDCPLYFSHDPRFAGLREHNAFDAQEKERNSEVLNNPRMRQAIIEVQQFFMRPLTGKPQISVEDREALDRVQKKLLPMIGLHQYPWIMGYIAPVLIGSRLKDMGGHQVRLEYKGAGTQSFSVEGMDGQQRRMFVPQKIQLCFSRNDGKEPMPLRRNGHPVEFDVSRAFARGIVDKAWGVSARRSAQLAFHFGN